MREIPKLHFVIRDESVSVDNQAQQQQITNHMLNMQCKYRSILRL